MRAGMAEATLLALRPTRLIILQYYVGWILAWILAVFLYWNPFAVAFLEWDIPALGIHLKTFLAWLLGFLGLVAVLSAEVRRRTIRYTITDNRIIRRDGLLRRRTMEIPFTQIERVELEQGVLQRIFGVGDIILDTGEDTITFESLRHVKLVHDELTKHVGMYSGFRTQAPARP